MRICQAQPNAGMRSETFLRTQAERLPASNLLLTSQSPRLARLDGSPLSRFESAEVWGARLLRKFGRATTVYQHLLRRSGAQVLVAHYGPTGVLVSAAAAREAVPLIVHFHGRDAWHEPTLATYSAEYRAMLGRAAASIAVSAEMVDQLIRLGAPPERVHLIPCGAPIERFKQTDPAENPPVFLAVGRLVDKKAPHLTILAFAKALELSPGAGMELRIVGEGPLRGACETLVRSLRIQERVTFLGGLTTERVAHELQQSRGFVQHSVTATDGDREGTPVSILEALASGVPVVATSHAGIREAVLDGVTGFLVDEGDIDTMAANISRLAIAPTLARQMGMEARIDAESRHSTDILISRLRAVVNEVV